MEEKTDILWSPSTEFKQNSNLQSYITWLNKKQIVLVDNYQDLWQWSVDFPSDFWKSIWEYFEIIHEGNFEEVLSSDPMPHTKWFEGSKLNYAEHIFRNKNKDYPAILFKSEKKEIKEISWEELERSVARLSFYFKEKGIKAGDRIVGYLPNCPEATIAFLACNSIGAIWSSTSPDFGEQSVIDRFRQIEPKIFIGIDGYSYQGKDFSRENQVKSIVSSLPTVENVIIVPYLNIDEPVEAAVSFFDILKGPDHPLTFQKVPFEHPIWVLYSSGTTGLPKPITHSNGGVLLEHLKYLSFHNNVKPGDRCFWYTTTGWMMWNYITASLLCGGTVVQYDGSPAFPNLNALWDFASSTKITHFGTSAGYVVACMKEGLNPGKDFNLENLVSIGSTGSPLPPEGFEWLYKNIKKDLWVASISGGTDVCSAFVGGTPLWPVYKGEIQCRALGCNLEAWDENGHPVENEVGEMVITQPMPSMPVYFWNDPEFKRYRESYFEHFPSVWRHGDWTRITKRKGIIIYGRSDSTLNRGGVRIGTSEIYRALDGLKEIKDSLIICLENANGEFYMPLFIVLSGKISLDTELMNKIKSEIRKQCSPRHVPDAIFTTPDIPYTISGKKVEMPVKKILEGKVDPKSLNRDALKNPESLDYYINFTKSTEFKWQKQ